MSSKLRLLIAAVAGAVAVFAFSPYGWWMLMPLSLAILFFLIMQTQTWRQAAWCGWVFGLAFFLMGLRWIGGALSGYIGLPLAAAAIVFILFCGYLSLFPALVGGVGKLLIQQNVNTTNTAKQISASLLILSGLWTIGEWLRGFLLTGFPWLAVGYSQTPHSWLSGYLPLIGIDGVNFLLALVAALLALLAMMFLRRQYNKQYIVTAAAILVLLFIGGAVAKQITWTQSAGTMKVALLQGNVTQDLKWVPQRVQQALLDYFRMSEKVAAQNPDLIILPETALPLTAEQLPDNYWQELQTAAGNASVVAGMFVKEEGKIYNAAVVADSNSKINSDFVSDSVSKPDSNSHPVDYRKRHLTPYGEYLPFAALLRPLLLAADIPFFGLSAGTQTMPLSVAGAKLAMAICYEDLFSHEWREQLPQGDLLINITNDGWFDGSDMAQQHLQISQTRAAEFGRYLLRAANTGMTAAIDDKGQVIDVLPPQIHHYLIADVMRMRGATPYIVWGAIPALLLSLLVIVIGLWMTRESFI